MEVLALVVERVGRRCFEEQSRFHGPQKLGVTDVSRVEAHVHHAHDREVLPPLGASRSDRHRKTQLRRRLARGEVADEDPFVDELRAHGRNAVVVPPERAHAVRHRRVRRHRDVRRTVPEPAAVLGPHERGASERDLVLEQPVRLGRMPAGLVDEQREELRREDERRRALLRDLFRS